MTTTTRTRICGKFKGNDIDKAKIKEIGDVIIERLKDSAETSPCDDCEKTPPCQWHECHIHCQTIDYSGVNQ
jgi:hypothetical protein